VASLADSSDGRSATPVRAVATPDGPAEPLPDQVALFGRWAVSSSGPAPYTIEFPVRYCDHRSSSVPGWRRGSGTPSWNLTSAASQATIDGVTAFSRTSCCRSRTAGRALWRLAAERGTVAGWAVRQLSVSYVAVPARNLFRHRNGVCTHVRTVFDSLHRPLTVDADDGTGPWLATRLARQVSRSPWTPASGVLAPGQQSQG